jgi:hypothetical protein
MAGGTKLEDLEVLRRDVSYMDLLGAERIPDPTTAGDFLRRLGEGEIGTSPAVWPRISARLHSTSEGHLRAGIHQSQASCLLDGDDTVMAGKTEGLRGQSSPRGDNR